MNTDGRTLLPSYIGTFSESHRPLIGRVWRLFVGTMDAICFLVERVLTVVTTTLVPSRLLDSNVDAKFVGDSSGR